MLESLEVPDDLQACQQLLREVAAAYDRLQQIHQELLATCTGLAKNATDLIKLSSERGLSAEGF